MFATFIHSRDPFRPRVNNRVVAIRHRTRIDTILRREGLISGPGRNMRRLSPFMVCLGSRAVLQSDWGHSVSDGDVLLVMALPRGGGGSNPLSMVLMVAVAIASVYTGGLVAAAYGSVAGAAAGIGVSIAGSLLVNAIVPPSTPNYASQTSPSPTYSIGAQGNSARVNSAIPRLYGRFRVYPDYAAQPYTEDAGNQQRLFQLFCITQGYVDIEEIRVGDTALSSFGADVQYEVIEPGGIVTLFPDNVVTSADVSGLEAKGANEKADTDPDNWSNVLGPFVANPATSEANYLAIDIGLQGLGYAQDSGGLSSATVAFRVEAQQINDSGVAVGGWFTLTDQSLTMATADPQLISYKYAVPSGRYQVRFTRTNDKNTDSRSINTLSWTGLRAYLPSKRTYGNVTLLAIEITATNNLNSSNAKQLNIIGTAKVPVWDGANWSEPQPTRSIAWAIADMCRDTTYGASFADSRLDLTELLRLDGVWAARGETFDGVFDSTQTFWDALTSVCYAGRAVPMYYANVIAIVRDEPKTVRTAMFTPLNMLNDTFDIDYTFLGGAAAVDCVDVTYTDPDSWADLSVRCALSDSPQRFPKAVTLMGCTSRTQAFKLGMYMCACNRDQRKPITFKTEWDGYIPKYGDRVSVSHDVAAYGQSGYGEGASWNPATKTLITSEPLEWTAGVTHYIQFRQRDGVPDGPFVATRGSDDSTVLVALTDAQRDSLYISDGYSEEPTHYSFGPSVETVSLECVMLTATPADDDTIELTMVNYAPSVYDAENEADVPPPPSASQLVRNSDAPAMSGLVVTMTQTPGEVLIASSAAAGANSYEFSASSDGGNSWQPLGTPTTPRITAQLSIGDWQIRARAIGVLPGPWAYWTGTVSTIVYTPGPPTLTLQQAFTGLSLVVNISGAEAANYFEVSVIVGGVVKTSYTTAARQLAWSIDDARNYNAVSPAVKFSVAAANEAGISAQSFLEATNPAPAAPVLSLSTDRTRLTVSAHGEGDLANAYIKAAGDADYQSSAVPFTIASLPATTFTAYVTDVWGNQSPSTTFTTPDADTSGGGGG